MNNTHKVYAVDLDSTLAQFPQGSEYDDDVIGEPFKGAKEFLRELQKRGMVLIYTVRTSIAEHGLSQATKNLRTVKAWLREHGLPYDDIYFDKTGKPNAVAFIDDKAVPCRPHQAGPEAAYKTALARIDLVLRPKKE